MKRNAIEHPKMTMLADCLDIPQYQAVGILESLWHYTAKYAKPGNLGKWTDDAIAKGIGYELASDKLVQALIESGWVDEHDEHRLVIHDWYEHADDAVHMALARATQVFATGQLPKLRRLGKSERQRVEQEYIRAESVRTENAQGAHAVRMPCAPPRPEPRQSPASATALAPPEPEPDQSTLSGKPDEPPPLTLKPRSNGRRRIDYAPVFEEFWKPYPRKAGKEEAFAAWKKVTGGDWFTHLALIAAVVVQSSWRVKPLRNDIHTVHASTWLNKKRWLDEEAVVVPDKPPPPSTTRRPSDQSKEDEDRARESGPYWTPKEPTL